MRRDILLLTAVIALGMHDPLVHDLGTVLCVGADGHVELEESAPAGCCGRAEAPGRVSLDSTSHCGVCVDLPLACADAATRAQAPVAGPSVLVERPLLPSVVPGSASRCRPLVRPASPRTELTSLRTVHLLI